VPTQLKSVLRSQILHSAVFGDFENLFLQAILTDDYELAKIVLEKCSFSERHQQVFNFYRAVTRQSQQYNNSLQFNTFSSESGAKYGKVEEYVNPFSAVVSGNEILIHNESGEALDIIALATQKHFLV